MFLPLTVEETEEQIFYILFANKKLNSYLWHGLSQRTSELLTFFQFFRALNYCLWHKSNLRQRVRIIFGDFLQILKQCGMCYVLETQTTLQPQVIISSGLFILV